jgi:hypothetical protein
MAVHSHNASVSAYIVEGVVTWHDVAAVAAQKAEFGTRHVREISCLIMIMMTRRRYHCCH